MSKLYDILIILKTYYVNVINIKSYKYRKGRRTWLLCEKIFM